MTAVAAQARKWQGPAFLAAAASIVVAAWLVVGSAGFATSGDLLALAVAADLVLVLPVLYYLLLVRGVGLPALTTLPVALLGLLVAGVILPGEQGITHILGLLALPLEALLVAILVFKARSLARAYREQGGKGSPAGAPTFDEAFPRAAHAALGRFRVVDLLISEVLVLYFALASWRQRPGVPPGVRAYSSHRDSSLSVTLVGVCAVIAIELPIVHLLVSLWSPAAAWVLTGLGLYGLLWLLGDYRAMVLRPTLLTADRLRLRVGMRWRADVPLSSVTDIRPYEAADGERGLPRLVAAGDPRHVLELAAPVELRGPFGIRRQAAALAVALDGKEFEPELRAAMRAHAAAETSSSTPPAAAGADARKSTPASSLAARTAEFRAAGDPDSWSAAAAFRWLARPVLERPRVWLGLNATFLGVLVGTGALLSFHPVLAGGLAEGLLAGGSAAAILEQVAAGTRPAELALLIFANNFLAIALLVVGLSLVLPYLGLLTGMAFAAVLGVGLAVALQGPLLPLLGVAPVVLLEQQAVALAWLFVLASGSALRGARRAGASWWEARRRAARGIGRVLVGVALILVLAAVLEAALILLH